jgi:ribosomal protein L3 glutamine methyltransferase
VQRDYPTPASITMTRSRPTPALPAAPSVADLIRHGAARFHSARLYFGHGTADAVDEAAALVFHELGLAHAEAAHAYPRLVSPVEVERVLAVFAQRIARRVPAAYLMRRMWFAGHEFEVDERVIVPRSPIAELIEARFVPWLEPDRVRRVLDIGTGSGCIAIACALALPAAQVDAVDLSPEALLVARRNVARHSVGARVRLLGGDVYSPLGAQRYELIVANPPYVSEGEMRRLPKEYRHEPELALRAGGDGLDVARRILAGLPERLTPGGVLVLEVGNSEGRLQRAYPGVPFTWLEFERGGGGVCLLTQEQALRHAAELRAGAVPRARG